MLDQFSGNVIHYKGLEIDCGIQYGLLLNIVYTIETLAHTEWRDMSIRACITIKIHLSYI